MDLGSSMHSIMHVLNTSTANATCCIVIAIIADYYYFYKQSACT